MWSLSLTRAPGIELRSLARAFTCWPIFPALAIIDEQGQNVGFRWLPLIWASSVWRWISAHRVLRGCCNCCSLPWLLGGSSTIPHRTHGSVSNLQFPVLAAPGPTEDPVALKDKTSCNCRCESGSKWRETDTGPFCCLIPGPMNYSSPALLSLRNLGEGKVQKHFKTRWQLI